MKKILLAIAISGISMAFIWAQENPPSAEAKTTENAGTTKEMIPKKPGGFHHAGSSENLSEQELKIMWAQIQEIRSLKKQLDMKIKMFRSRFGDDLIADFSTSSVSASMSPERKFPSGGNSDVRYPMIRRRMQPKDATEDTSPQTAVPEN